MLGCRSTALVYMVGFEMLAARSARYRNLADRMVSGLIRNATPCPSTLDDANAFRLGTDMLESWQIVSDTSKVDYSSNTYPLEAPPRVGMTHFPNAGIAIIESNACRIFVGYKLGGVVVVANLDSKLIEFEDAGYLATNRRGSDWVSRYPGSGHLQEIHSNGLTVECTFFGALHEDMRPAQLILLRTLNLTVLRIQWIADLFRHLVAKRLISGSSPKPWGFSRKIFTDGGRLVILDRFSASKPSSVSGILRCRRVTGAHMASSRYFQPIEADASLGPWTRVVSCDSFESGISLQFGLPTHENVH